MNDEEALNLLQRARVATLHTIRPGSRPHSVPFVFALADRTIVSAIDHKPKKTTNLTRLANIEANPTASVLCHHYVEDWTDLWWVRADGNASILASGTTGHQEAIDLLVGKYDQYRRQEPAGPVISIAISSIDGWRGAPPSR